MKILNLFMSIFFVALVSGQLEAGRCGCSVPRPTKPAKPTVKPIR